ncbi:MAG: acyltransferase [Coriobacteriales bacterium]|nr:acyltransferase [Coriobacteriales bacterium]
MDGPISIMEGVTLTGPNVRIGSRTMINRGCLIDGSGDVVIGSGVSLGFRVSVLSMTHDIGPAGARAGASTHRVTAIGDGVWIGAGTLVLPGAEIGAGCVVGAGAVVSGVLPPNVMALGVPARPMRLL